MPARIMQSSMRRWAPNLAAALSAAVILLALGMWVLSASEFWFLKRSKPNGDGTFYSYFVFSLRGDVACAISHEWRPGYVEDMWEFERGPISHDARRFFGEFRWINQGISSPLPSTRPSRRTWAVYVPWWFIALLASVLPAWWVWRWRRARKLVRSRGFEVVAAGKLARSSTRLE
jgi:hypothetical protein